MTVKQPSELLISDIETTVELDGRYRDLKAINVANDGKPRQGVFSIVFKAWDTLDEKHVAIKFYDPDQLGQKYRLNCFDREHELLTTLLGRNRCLQVLSGKKTHQIEITTDAGFKIPLPCNYFVVEWIAFDICDYFWADNTLSEENSLKLFHDLLLSVEALHRNGIAHRDLKPDNLRARDEAIKRIIVAIDLGGAARADSSPLQGEYRQQVGAWPYSPVESLIGFAGDRSLGEKTDAYALGCMLWELFHDGAFYKSGLEFHNPHWRAIYSAIDNLVRIRGGNLNALATALDQYGHSISPIKLNEVDCSLSPGVINQVEAIIQSLTHFDFRQRMSLANARDRTRSAITVLQNERFYQKRLLERKIRRERRMKKIEQRAARLRAATALALRESTDASS